MARSLGQQIQSRFTFCQSRDHLGTLSAQSLRSVEPDYDNESASSPTYVANTRCMLIMRHSSLDNVRCVNPG